MKQLLILLALGCSAPALAQHQGHGGHDQHQAHPPTPQMPETPKPRADATPEDPHAGHRPPSLPADPHAAHGPAPASPAPPVAPPSPAAFGGPAHAADSVYGSPAMAEARDEMRESHGSIKVSKAMLDRLEARIRRGRDGYAWEGEAWYGGDIDKLWLKTEGEGAFGKKPESAEIQALWSHAIDPWFDLQLGLRHDFRPDPERTYFAVGVEGLAPYWFEIDAAAFVSEKGDVSTRLEGEYDLRLTQRLILQPRVEANFALQDVPEIGVGSGLSTVETGLRLRYEIKREFAPYVGLEYERAFGGTARLRRAGGEAAGGWSLLMGLRAWF